MNYELVIPSRRRVEQAAKALTMLPDALISVDEREEAEYLKQIPRDHLVTHPPMRGLGPIRRWTLENSTCEWVVMCDDDLKHVESMVGRKPKKYTAPGVLRRLIENQIQVADDLGIRMFAWSRGSRPGQFHAAKPFYLAGPCSGCFGVRTNHGLEPDRRLLAYEDVDQTLTCLLRYRIILQDMRFYWRFGSTFTGAGGGQGIRTSDTDAADRRVIYNKWGAHISLEAKSHRFNSCKSKGAMSIRVDRKSAIVSHR